MTNMEFTENDNKAVKWCEDNYPELTKEYKEIMMKQYVLFIIKILNDFFSSSLKSSQRLFLVCKFFTCSKGFIILL